MRYSNDEVKNYTKNLYSLLIKEFGKDFISEKSSLKKGDLAIASKTGNIGFDKHIGLLNALELPFDLFLDQKIDIETLKEHLGGNISYIPKRYRRYKCSKIRTISSINSHLEEIFGKSFRLELERYFQIRPHIYSDLDDYIGSFLLIDIYSYLEKKGLTQEFFEQFGRRAAYSFQSSELTDLFPTRASVQDVYETFFSGLTPIVEKNQNYAIERSSSNEIVLSHFIKEETKENLKQNIYGTRSMCYHIKGWFSGFMRFNTDWDANVTKLSCVHDGDHRCSYRVDYAHYRPLR